MTSPTTVYVILAKDSKGKPRGFEKSNERFYLSEGEADGVHTLMDDLERFFTVHPCVIMGDAEYCEMVRRIHELELQIENLENEVQHGNWERDERD